MPLPFEPVCLPLLLDSLPYTSAQQALETSRKYAGVLLAWPQLPNRSYRERALVQSSLGFPGLTIEEHGARVFVQRAQAEARLDELALAYLENALSYAALGEDSGAGLVELGRRPEYLVGARALKGQLLGPISLAAQLTDERQRPLLYDDTLLAALGQHLRLRAIWQEARLGDLLGTTIICLNEPFLDVIGLPFVPIDWETARMYIDEVFSGIIGCKGLYASGSVDWTQVLNTSVELIIADVYHHSAALIGAAAALPEFMERDGVVGFGIVPADADELSRATPATLVHQLSRLIESLSAAGVPTEILTRQAVISTSGSLGRLDIVEAERALQLVAEVSTQLQAQYGLVSP